MRIIQAVTTPADDESTRGRYRVRIDISDTTNRQRTAVFAALGAQKWSSEYSVYDDVTVIIWAEEADATGITSEAEAKRVVQRIVSAAISST